MVTVAGIAIPDEIEIMIVACQTGEPLAARPGRAPEQFLVQL
jgi:hypothetical protein